MAIAPIQLSQRGLTGERDPSRLRSGDLSIATNLDFSVPGLVQKEPGSTKRNASALAGAPAIMAGVDWFADESTQRTVLATADGKLWKDDLSGAFATTLASGLGTNKITHFCQGGNETVGRNKKLFAFNRFDPVQVLTADGATTHATATPPADWTGNHQPSFGFPFDVYILAGGNDNNGHFLYGNNGSDHEDWIGGTPLLFAVYPGVGQRLVGGITAFDRAWVFKYPRGIFWLDDAGASTTWRIKPASPAHKFGMAATPWAITGVDEKTVAFMTASGAIVLMEPSANTTSGVDFTELTGPYGLNLRETIRQEFNVGRFDRTQLVWDDDHRQLNAIYAGIGSGAEDRRLVIDFNSERPRAEITRKDTNECLFVELDSNGIGRLMGGDNAGFLRKLGQAARTVDGAGYPFAIQTSPTDFSDINPAWAVKKAFTCLHLEYEAVGNFDVSVDVYLDGALAGTVTFNMGTTGSTLPFALPGVLGGNELRRRYKDIGGDGYQLALRITESGANNPRLARAWVEFQPLGMAA